MAARWLARQDAKRIAVIGAGEQARLQLRALALVRCIEEVFIWARKEKPSRDMALEMSLALGVPCTVAASVHTALQAADIAITTTASREALVQARDLHPGLRITAMGSDAEHKTEIAPAALVAARYFCDRLAQARALGELHHAIEAGAVAPEAKFPELGQVIAGTTAGRISDTEITLCDLTGTGVQDTAIAVLALKRVRASGKALVFDG